MRSQPFCRISRFFLFLAAIFAFFQLAGCEYIITEYNSIDDYGIITGNGTNERAEEIFSELFPKSIPESFKNPVYHYRAEKGPDACAFEIALEFSMDALKEFDQYVESVSSGTKLRPFPYCEGYLYAPIGRQWFLLGNDVRPCQNSCYEDAGNPEHYHIDSARIAMMIIQPNTRQVILFGMGVADGGGVSTYDLNWIFSRFKIAPLEFARDHPYISNRGSEQHSKHSLQMNTGVGSLYSL